MALPQLFSRRKRQESNATNDVYYYDQMPPKLRVQVIHIIREAVGEYYSGYENEATVEVYDHIADTMRKELGVFSLRNYTGRDSSEELFNWFLNEEDIDIALDFVEYSINSIDRYVRANLYKFKENIKSNPDEAIAEVNARMKEAGFGYSFDSGQLIRIDSQVAHADIVVPALKLLADPTFGSANVEYLAAHAAFRRGDYETAIVECAKAFESTLKVIGTKRNWAISPNDAATRLLDAAYAAGFIEPPLQAEFTALRSLLSGGVPTVRNRQGGHGAGATPRQVPPELAAFQLHQTAAAIIFLVEHDRAAP